jgi:hypothetical protein
MRENRQSGSEGGAGLYTLFLPLSNGGPVESARNTVRRFAGDGGKLVNKFSHSRVPTRSLGC